MLNTRRLQRSSGRTFRALTGMSRNDFRRLLPSFARAFEEQERRQSESSKRQRKPGAGGKRALERMDDLLLFILVYFNVYPTQDLQALLFGLTQPWAHKWIHRLTPVLRQALGYEKQLPLRRTRSTEDLQRLCPELEFLLDGTERPVVRPSKEPTQRERYSGKKKRHTVKNNIVSSRKTKKVLLLGATAPGKTHDKRMVDDEPILFPPGSVLHQDLGFQGHVPLGVDVRQPKKKPRKAELSPTDKEHNRVISQVRIGVEHTIGGVKISNIVHDIYRNRTKGFEDTVIEIACGLHNHRVEGRLKMAA